MAEKEAELRKAASSGNVALVNQLLEEGVAQTADEARFFGFLFHRLHR